MRDIIFGVLWAFLLPLSFYSAHLAILLWIWVALLAPNDMLYGVIGSVPFNKVVAVIAIAVLLVSKERKRFYNDGLLTLMALFGLVVTLSYLLQAESNATLDQLYDKFWKILVLAVLMSGILYTRHRLHQAALLVSLAYGFFMVKEALIFLLTAGGHKIQGAPSVGDNNGLALAILMTIPLLLYCAKYSAVPWVRRIMQITAGLGAVTVIATFSRGGFIGLVVLGCMMFQGSKRKWQAALILVAAAIVLVAVAGHAYFTRVDTIADASTDDSFGIRLLSWKINLLIALDHPLLGGGLNASAVWTYWSMYAAQASDLFFPTPIIWRSFVAHSIYFEVLGDTGFTGLVLFLSILATVFVKMLRVQRMARGDPSLAWAGDLARALQVSFVVYCVSGAALSFVYNELVFVMLALVSRTHQTAKELTAEARDQAATPASRRLLPAYRRAA